MENEHRPKRIQVKKQIRK